MPKSKSTVRLSLQLNSAYRKAALWEVLAKLAGCLVLLSAIMTPVSVLNASEPTWQTWVKGIAGVAIVIGGSILAIWSWNVKAKECSREAYSLIEQMNHPTKEEPK